MNWLLLLHIAAMLCWCGSLLYLPAVVSGTVRQKNNIEMENKKISKLIFTLILTPAALITIISGTLVFVAMKTTDLWLIMKLTLVTGLVICHALNGWLIMKTDTLPPKIINFYCRLCSGFSILLMIAIFWLVLAKPALGNLI